MTTNVAFDINEFVESLESYAADCRKFCRSTLFKYDNLLTFTNCFLRLQELKKPVTHVDMAKEMLVDEGVVAFLIRVISENADSLFLAKDIELANQVKAINWEEFLVATQETLFVNIMFADTDEDIKNDWSWHQADGYITINLPLELPKEYADHIHNLDLGEAFAGLPDGSWGNYLRLDSFSRKNDISVSTNEEKKELLEMYRLMNKYLG